MFLAPQHFQEWDLQLEAWHYEKLRQNQPFSWGFHELDVDPDALCAGRFALRQARGILPDGTGFRIPEYDEPPEGRVVGGHMAGGSQYLDVFLGLAELREGGQNLADGTAGNGPSVRYLTRSVRRPDLTTGAMDRDVIVGAKNLVILFGDESLDGFTVLRAARLTKTATGGLELSEHFAPACLSIGASPCLTRVVRRVVDMLAARSTALAGARRQRGTGAMEFGVADISAFWLLHTVNSALPSLIHALAVKNHPVECYLRLSTLAAELMTFLPAGHPADLAAYSHDQPAVSFEQLEGHIRQGLEMILSSSFLSIPLEKTREHVWTGRVQDERMFGGTRTYLAMSGEISEQMMGSVVPSKIKIGSPNTIENLIGAALRGVGISHLTWLPSQIPARAGYQYFQIDTSHELWNDIRLSKTIAIYLPAEYSQAKMDLITVLE